MPVSYSCPNCNFAGTADDTVIGETIRCPKCLAAIKVAASGEARRAGTTEPAEIADADALDADAAGATETSAAPDAVRGRMPGSTAVGAGGKVLSLDHLLTTDADNLAEPEISGSMNAPLAMVAGAEKDPEPQADQLPAAKGGPGADRIKFPLQADQRYCPKCGGVISTKTHICRHCQFDLNFEHLLTGEQVTVGAPPLAASAFGPAGMHRSAKPAEPAKKGCGAGLLLIVLLVVALAA